VKVSLHGAVLQMVHWNRLYVGINVRILL